VVEEGLKRLSPSSCEILLPRAGQHTQTSRLTTLMVPFNNIERHAKTTKTAPETPHRTKNRPQETNRNQALSPQKFFSALNVHPYPILKYSTYYLLTTENNA
jgi:hypothetical protein